MHSIVQISAQNIMLHITRCRLIIEIFGFCYGHLGTGGRYVVSFESQATEDSTPGSLEVGVSVDSGHGLRALGKIKTSYLWQKLYCDCSDV
jgi:hypothetical protein